MIGLFLITSVCVSQPCQRDPFLDLVQYRSFLYFWELTNPQNGLTPDRSPTYTFCSIAAVGFGLSSYLVAVERQWIGRAEAAERVLTTLRFFWNAAQGTDPAKCTGYQGFFYHFLDMQTGLRYANVELSSIDTTLLMAGILSVATYFDQDNPVEYEIRVLADELYRRMNWTWFCVRPNLVSMGWHPETGFLGHDWQGYNEGMILYILGLGSPTHPLPKEAWESWCNTYIRQEFQHQTYIQFAPLFGHQYSHIWIDFRGIQDDYMQQKQSDYFQNSRAAVYANRSYCISNPQGWQGYSDRIWGLTACDGPADKILLIHGKIREFHTYWARGASTQEICDDGTIAPTAAGGSIPFAPEICIPALKAMYEQYGTRIFGAYGFYDAFNLTYPQEANGWFDQDYLGIDQGPIVLMIENYTTEFLWSLMKKNPYIKQGLQKAGFRGGWLDSK